MRSELTNLEKIDLYLSGNLSPDEKAAFEKALNENPTLKQQVKQQQQLIQAVNRKALRAQINAVAAGAGGASGGFSNVFLGIGGVVVVGVTATALFYFSSDDYETTMSDPDPVANEIIMNSPVPDVMDSVRTDDYLMDEDGWIKETPETIFSSVNNYDDEEENDRMNVTVNFQSRGERLTVVKDNKTKNNTGNLVEVDEHNDAIKVDTEIDENEIINRAQRASFPGGNGAMKKFIDKNLRYPKSAEEKDIEAVIRCDFHVTADGLITEIDAKCIKMCEEDGVPFNDIRILVNKRLVNSFIGNATHVLRTMPSWEPAKNADGNPIISNQRMYFNYDMERGCRAYQLED